VFTKTNVEAAAAANFFHYTEHSVTSLKAFLQNEISIRHDTQAKYLGSMLDKYGRLLKKTDDELDRMKFSIIEKEII
jgi:cyclase